ncbi:6-pyruvoyl trahydropterin synthase family protein [Blattabacterium cuenoti]|uniref:6-pyruvoyl trahydropterin synthase family protein n=1 Tax=Blattabacterium cuenoti TaxID=1653831 RepID=UPI00163C127C|nr:6-carboxytetrahydropterin synthase [Blattabacterium cuenoti]
MKIIVSKKGYFSASHKLYNHFWDEKKNIETFGKCYNNHGHNYKYIVSIKGEINPITGFVINLNKLKNILNQEIKDCFDHKNINLELKEFRTINPTLENIVVFIWKKIRNKICSKFELKIVLYETENNFVEYDGN